MQVASPVHVLLVSGSTRSRSTNSAAVRTAHEVAPDGVETAVFDGLAALPAFNPDDDVEPAHRAVATLRRQLARADAVVFCTPEYAGTLPGSFKNLIDWVVGSGELYRKPVAWVNVAAPGRGAGAEATLGTVLRYVDAAVIEAACVRVPVPRDAVGDDGFIREDAIRQQLAGVLQTTASAVSSPTAPV